MNTTATDRLQHQPKGVPVHFTGRGAAPDAGESDSGRRCRLVLGMFRVMLVVGDSMTREAVPR